MKRSGLARDELDALLAALDSQRERAGEIYESIRARLLKFFNYRGASHPEELTDETIDRVGRRLAQGESIRSADAGRYFLGVARNVLFEAWDREKSRPPETDVELAGIAETMPQPDADDDAAFACLDDCLQTLAPETRNLMLRYFGGGRGESVRERRALAIELGIEISVLRLRIFRFRTRLEHCVRGCLERGSETNHPVRPPAVRERGHS